MSGTEQPNWIFFDQNVLGFGNFLGNNNVLSSWRCLLVNAVTDRDLDLTALTATITAAYLENNNVSMQTVPSVIASIYAAFASLGKAPPPTEVERPAPAVPIRKSVTSDYIVCLEDGKKLKMLKRHLQSAYGMTPDEYRARWGLPADYPMVAPSYAAARSNLAKAAGLGRKPGSGQKRGAAPV
ncbi:hypothetical protein CHT98_31910 (plasmid) [Azospirillum brasilense]|uniref:MucR family transcriptional regulator n=1 Tax=Azospirillum brasilense TaxID=192 RepID=A0A235H374_AZOBR|nr:hypothetical protein CHT98_31910 [Azospirillum brasilense]